MPQQHLKEQWRDILLELLLAIGHELDVDKQLQGFLPAFLRKLSCHAVAVFEADPVFYQDFHLIKQLPRPAKMQNYAALLSQSGLTDGQVIASDAVGKVYAFELSGFGYLCLKHPDLSDIFRHEMRQICVRLSYTLRACRQHQQLQQSQQQLAQFFELSDNFMCILNNKGYLTKLNPAFLTKLSYPVDEFYANSFVSFVHEQDQAETQSILDALSQGQTSATFTNRLRDKHGLYLDFAWDMSAEASTGLIYASAMDITQQVEIQHNLRRAKEAAEQTAQVKAAFLANMSHEIRTPLNGVLGMLELVLKQPVSPAIRQQLMTALQSGQSLLSIVNDVLDFSKINAGKLHLESINFNLDLLLQEVIDSFRYLAQQKKLQLQLDTHDLHHLWCLGDPFRIRQILNNLLSNAFKFTTAGQICCVAKSAQTETGVQIELTVSDSGIGLSEAQQIQIFQAFSQADVSTTRRFGGTGLGLTICKELVELMQGDLRVQSQLGQGSAFTIVLQLMQGESETLCLLPEQRVITETLQGKRLLLVEDNPVNREIALSMLRQLQCEVDSAEDGLIALSMLQQGQSQLYEGIIMDCLMPEMDGFTATRAIRQGQAGAQWQNIPILALTANAMSEDRQRCLAAGMNAYLSKPYTLEQLQQGLYSLFSGLFDEAVNDRLTPTQGNIIEQEIPAALKATEASGPSLWQVETFDKNFKGMESISHQVMAIFRQQLPQTANALKQALQQSETHQINLLAHGLKSTAAQVGCLALSQLAKTLEQSTKTDPAQDYADLVAALLELIMQTELVLSRVPSLNSATE